MATRSLDVIAVVEACYRLELDEEPWLRGVVDAARPFLGRGASGYLYDASSGVKLEITTACIPEDIDPKAFMGLLASVPPEYLRDAWMRRRVAYASQIAGFDEGLKAGLRALDGATDALAVNGLDPSARGFWLGAPLFGRVVRSERKLALLERVSTHLAAAYRMRRLLAGGAPSADAVLRPDGKVEHARGDAREADARAELRTAVVRVERARTKAGRRDPEAAVAAWRGLVSARWTLVDDFQRDGSRYIVARQNTATTVKVRALTKREMEVLSWASLGQENKTIAYELGISHQTVRVLMHRAAQKLGAPNRRVLLEKFAALIAK